MDFSKCWRWLNCVLQIILTVAGWAEIAWHLSFIAEFLFVDACPKYLFSMMEQKILMI